MPKVTCMPRTRYNRTIDLIEDYPTWREELKELKAERTFISAQVIDGMPHSTTVGRPTEKKALRVATLEHDIKVMENCIKRIDPELKDGIVNNIIHKTRFPYFPSESTWKREKRKFVIDVAERFGIYHFK